MKVEQHIQELARACPPSPILTQTELTSPPENSPTLQAELIASPPPQAPLPPTPPELNPP